MKLLMGLLLISTLWGCHHDIQPQGDEISPNTAQVEIPAENLLADFARRY